MLITFDNIQKSRQNYPVGLVWFLVSNLYFTSYFSLRSFIISSCLAVGIGMYW